MTRIAGRIVGDDDAFDDRALGEGWAWDDLSAGLRHVVRRAAVQRERRQRRRRARRGEPGQPADVALDPDGTGLTLSANVTTAAADATPSVVVWRRPFDTHLEVTGAVPKAERDYVRTVAVDNPTQFFVNALRDTLIQKGIAGRRRRCRHRRYRGPVAPAPTNGTSAPSRTVLFSHQSPPLSEIGVTFMKVSQNLFGETLLNAVGLQAGLEPCPSTATV